MQASSNDIMVLDCTTILVGLGGVRSTPRPLFLVDKDRLRSQQGVMNQGFR